MAGTGLDLRELNLQEGLPSTTSVMLVRLDGRPKTLEEIKLEVVKLTLEEVNGQASEACRRLRIGRSTIYRWLRSNPA